MAGTGAGDGPSWERLIGFHPPTHAAAVSPPPAHETSPEIGHYHARKRWSCSELVPHVDPVVPVINGLLRPLVRAGDGRQLREWHGQP